MQLLALLATIASTTAARNTKIFLPKPVGNYHVAKTQHVLNHTTYDDPVAPPNSNSTGSFIVATILYPTELAPTENTSTKYMDDILAAEIEKGLGFPTGELQKLWTHIQWQAPIIPQPNGLPTLLFSPGAGLPCASSIVAMSDMTSQGYTVLCIDHPGEPPYLEIPYGGGGVYGVPVEYGWDDIDFVYKVNRYRKSDYAALLELFPGLVEQFGAPFNTSAYLHFGFSMGGSIGTDLVARHDSVLAGLNYDGAFVDSLFNETVDVKKPFLMLRDNQNRTGDVSWPDFIAEQTGWWEHLLIKGTKHLDFCDMSLWFELLELENENLNVNMPGLIKGSRMRNVLTAITTSFFDMVLGKSQDLIGEGRKVNLPNEEWPDVVFVNNAMTWNGTYWTGD
ncbi:hypothetical protein BS50DRAFT_660723 [Corynespora cassiicola Philippines]|uniref:1-alkyl-2-acetylglycerophosphocholine esterase n=1 Tax=Corynespora cassiicola Philippines TaxID=1448308 RepID=A0A2T2P1H1_CORCC|nr:hypothetical protein BS50DRAFT_660723 [Corynespora cassiicola Philippines]